METLESFNINRLESESIGWDFLRVGGAFRSI